MRYCWHPFVMFVNGKLLCQYCKEEVPPDAPPSPK